MTGTEAVVAIALRTHGHRQAVGRNRDAPSKTVGSVLTSDHVSGQHPGRAARIPAERLHRASPARRTWRADHHGRRICRQGHRRARPIVQAQTTEIIAHLLP